MIKRCLLRGAQQTTAHQSDDVGLWPTADELATGRDVGLSGSSGHAVLAGHVYN